MRRARFAQATLRTTLQLALLALLCVGVSGRAAAAPRDCVAPTPPGQLRLTAVGAYQVSLAWDASRDASGSVFYRIGVSDGRELTVPYGATSARIAWGLSPNVAYAFSVTAIDAAGNRSRPSNVVRATLPADVTAPTTPVLSVAYTGSHGLALTWTEARDDGPRVSYQVALDGHPVLAVSGTSTRLTGLAPDTSYSVSVRAIDPYGNASAFSAAVEARTLADDGVDVTAPSAPGRFVAFDDYCGDVFVVWDASVDDRDPSDSIRYDLYVNGDLKQSVVGRNWAALSLPDVGPTLFELVAVDEAGNTSAAVTTELDLEADCQ